MELTISDHKRKLVDEIKKGISGKIESLNHAAKSGIHAECGKREHSDFEEKGYPADHSFVLVKHA